MLLCTIQAAGSFRRTVRR